MNAPAIEFPALVFTDKTRKFSCAYSAANPKELQVCPVHTYLRTGRLAGLRLYDSKGRCLHGRATGRWSLDKELVHAVGPVIWTISAVLSGFNVPLVFEIEWHEAGGEQLEQVKRELSDYVRGNPTPHTRQHPLGSVLARVNRATTYGDLCRAL